MKRPLLFSGRSLVVRSVAVIGVLCTAFFGFIPLAEAHTDFESSSPANGAVVDRPVSSIQLRFTAASIVAGDGFVVLTPAGELIQPEIQVSDDEQEFTLVFDPALTDGVVGVQWSVRAGDAHPIEGAFSFSTTATAPVAVAVQPESVDVTPVPTTSPLVSQQPVSGIEGASDSNGSSTNDVAAASGADVAADALATSGDSSSSLDPATGSSPIAGSAAAISLEDFLNTDTGNGGAGPLGYLGRLASQAGSLVAIGVIGFAVLVSRQRADETQMYVFLIRQAAALTLVGAALRAIALVIELGGFSDGLINSTGLAVGLRAGGATALLLSSGRVISQTATSRSIAASRRERTTAAVGSGSFSGAVGLLEHELAGPLPTRPGSNAPNALGPIAIWPAALIALSFVFDGHTVTKGNHLLTGLVAVVHVVGGGVWLGGLICLALLSRRRSIHGSDFVDTVVRFSVVAAAALAAVGAAGLVLTVTILDSVSELWTTAWGRILIAKVLIVAVAVAAGAFNHYVLVPEMQSVSAHDDARRAFVQTLVVELIALGVAVAVTAFLVAAAS